MTAYYNEIDAYAAQWLRNLIAAKLIAPGDVDERSIEDVSPDDLRGYRQCHFFAGIGIWSYTLRRAGWSDDREVWTGSCPCQPFSAAGKGAGFADERHLWPAFFHLIRVRRPDIVLGEQVASKDGLAWLDLVQADLEAAHYPVGAVDTCSAGFGAPHIRQRLYWMARAHSHRTGRDSGTDIGAERSSASQGCRHRNVNDTDSALKDGIMADTSDARLQIRSIEDDGRRALRQQGPPAAAHVVSGELADTDGGHTSAERQQRSWQHGQQQEDGGASELEQSGSIGWQRRQETAPRHDAERPTSERPEDQHGCSLAGPSGIHQDGTGPTNGFWRAADWLFCRDGKWRPVEEGTFPLAHGDTSRVGGLRAFGNAINAEQATEFCIAVDHIERLRLMHAEGGVFA